MSESAPPPAASKGQRRSAALAFILIMVWIDVLSWGVTIPVYPRLFTKFTHGDMAQAAALVGLFMTVFAGVQLFAAPVLGALSDRFGRRAVILAACFGLGVDLLAMAWAPNLWWLFATRIVHAVTAASQSAAMAYVADVTPAERRARAFGLTGAAFSVGFIVGPGVGGMLGQIDLRLPFLVGAGLALLNFAYGLFVLPESLPRERRRRFQIAEANPFGVLKFLRVDAVVFALAGVLVLMQLTFQLYPSVWVLYTSYRYDWDPMGVGATLAFSGVLGALIQGLLVGPLVRRLGERAALLAGLACWCVGCVLMALASKGWMFVAAMPFGALGGIAGPALNAAMSGRVAADRQGELQGAATAITSLTGLVGPTLFAGSFAYAISAAARVPIPGAPFFIAAALLCGAFAVAARAAPRAAGARI